MDGLVIMLDKAGLTIGSLEARVSELEQENAVLRQQLTANGAPSDA